ncbi:MAG: BrnT family toxin [Candidatus Aminicenantes bacterium]|nr:BrnT family toxin [Candidatus Aminicenantes bacterium]
MKYKWDPKKARQNYQKHGVHFSELEPVFEDERALLIDEVVYGGERRILIGMDGLARVLIVVYILHENDIWIISARKAAQKERKLYGIC